MDKEKWYRNYARYKWEFLRRNTEYRKDVDESIGWRPAEKTEDSSDDYIWYDYRREFYEKWKLIIPCDYRYSIDEIPDEDIIDQIYKWAKGSDLLKGKEFPVSILDQYEFLEGLVETCLWFRGKRPIDDIDEELDELFRFLVEKDTKMKLVIDLAFDKEIILNEITRILEYVERHKSLIPPEELPARQRHTFDKYTSYLKVWDMRRKGLPFPEIAREVFPYDFTDPHSLHEDDPDQKPEAKIDLVEYYYREAEKLVTHGI